MRITCLPLLLAALPLWGLGVEGHRTVAILAESRLTPDAQAKIKTLLFDGKFTLAQISTCADVLRNNPKYPIRPDEQYCLELGPANAAGAPWHYIDIPLPKADKPISAYCPKGNCVTERIEYFRWVLKNSPDPAKRREALMYLVHFLADMHQPLHSAERSCDQGGNLESANLQTPRGEPATHSLHRVWDEDVVEVSMRRLGAADPASFAAALAAKIQPAQAADWKKASIDAMAWEGWKLAQAHVYAGIPYYDYCDLAVKAKKSPPSDLSALYLEDGAKVIQEQMSKAAVRLADLIEKALRP